MPETMTETATKVQTATICAYEFQGGVEPIVYPFEVGYFSETPLTERELLVRLRDGIYEFLRTAEGASRVQSNNGWFNWGDAVNDIPEEWWPRFGIAYFRGISAGHLHPSVEHGENFANGF